MTAADAALAPTPLAPVTSPHGWPSADIAADPHWALTLTRQEVTDFELGLQNALATGKRMFELSRRDFAFGPSAVARLRSSAAEMNEGRGFQLLRGFPTERLGTDDARLLF